MTEISIVNSILYKTLQGYLTGCKGNGNAEFHVHEFDDFRYCLTESIESPKKLRVSVGIPKHQSPLFPQESKVLIEENLGEVVTLCKVDAGYDVSFDVNLGVLQNIEANRRKALVEGIASVRALLIEPRLRRLLQSLGDGQLGNGGLQSFKNSKGDKYFAKPLAGMLRIIFPLRKDGHSNLENTMGGCFVHHFSSMTEGKQGLGPGCVYHPVNKPPPEFDGLEDDQAGNCHGGFFTLRYH